MLYTKLTIVFDETPNTVFVWKRKNHHGYHGNLGTINSLDQTLSGDQTHDNYPTIYIKTYYQTFDSFKLFQIISYPLSDETIQKELSISYPLAD